MKSRWRIQARWTVGTDARSYAPVFEVSREAAESTAVEMRRTLAHFPTLEVVITQVEEARALEEEAALAARQALASEDWLHLLNEKERSRTECGLPASATNWLGLSVWKLSGSNKKCSACSAARQT